MANSIERTGKFYYGDKKDPLVMDESLLIGNASKKLKEEKEFKEIAAKKVELAKAKQEEILARLETLELVPWGNRVLILPYPENPYRKIVTESGIFVDYSGGFFNPESGEQDTLAPGVICAKVIEIGPDCTYVQSGDDVFVQKNTTYPVPFMSMGYLQTSEPQILNVLAEGLKERFKKINNKAYGN